MLFKILNLRDPVVQWLIRTTVGESLGIDESLEIRDFLELYESCEI